MKRGSCALGQLAAFSSGGSELVFQIERMGGMGKSLRCMKRVISHLDFSFLKSSRAWRSKLRRIAWNRVVAT